MVSSTSCVGSYQGGATCMRLRWQIQTAWLNWKCSPTYGAFGSSKKFITSRSKFSKKRVVKATCETIPSQRLVWAHLGLRASPLGKATSISLVVIQSFGSDLGMGSMTHERQH